MSTISLCMIVRNEERNIRRCLASVAGAVDEMIVVDTGSEDGTCAVAGANGAKVLRHPWNDDFAAARNASLEPATGDWIFFLDADEELAAGAGETLRRTVESAPDEIEGYFARIANLMGDPQAPERHPDVVFRLFRNRPEYRFHGAIHEQVADVIERAVGRPCLAQALDVEIVHRGYLGDQNAKIARNLAMLEQVLAGTTENYLYNYHYGIELYRAGRYRDAIGALTRAFRGLGQDQVVMPKLLRALVVCHHQGGEYQAALDIATLGLCLYPDFPDLRYWAGMACVGLGRYAEARDHFIGAVTAPVDTPPGYGSVPSIRRRANEALDRLMDTMAASRLALLTPWELLTTYLALPDDGTYDLRRDGGTTWLPAVTREAIRAQMDWRGPWLGDAEFLGVRPEEDGLVFALGAAESQGPV